MCDRPTRRARDEAETFLPVEAIDFVDDAVDVVVEMRASRFDFAMEGEQFLDRVAKPGQRIGGETAGLEPLDHAGLGIGRHLAHLPPGISKEAERPRCGNRRVELTQRTGRGVSRINVERLAGLRLLAVEFEKRRLGHVDLAAHLADRRNALALEALRHVLQRADIGGDVLALAAVAAGRAGDEFSVFIAKRHGQAVNLRLSRKCDRFVIRKPQESADAANKIDHVLFGKRIVQREHRNSVTHLGKTRRRRRTDVLRQAVARS